MSIGENIKNIRAALPPQVALIAVSKKVDAPRIREAIAAGQTVFGENYVQEAAGKWPTLRADNPAIRVHLIGHLQSNKAEDAVKIFDRIDTVDSEKLVLALTRAMEKTGRHIPVLLEVNIGREEQKAGVMPEHAAALLGIARKAGLDVQGLMCIPPADKDPAPYFIALRAMVDELKLSVCSMGMSADYELAAKHGATEVRVGTALFGARG